MNLLTPALSARCFHLKSIASPPSIQASDEPTVDVPIGSSLGFIFHKLPIMSTHLFSRSAVIGYSSLSIAFFSKFSAINAVAVGSI